ncbi:MAG: hypothetical protein R3C45_08220 [Phycisphaerales bacterium]
MLPTFETFATKPSWHNRAGRIDRSACVELKPSDLWRDIPRERWQVFVPNPLEPSFSPPPPPTSPPANSSGSTTAKTPTYSRATCAPANPTRSNPPPR